MHWPITNSAKEVMFLDHLEEVFEATQPQSSRVVWYHCFKLHGALPLSLIFIHDSAAERKHILGSLGYRTRILYVESSLFPAKNSTTRGDLTSSFTRTFRNEALNDTVGLDLFLTNVGHLTNSFSKLPH